MGEVVAINLITLREGVAVSDFARFSAELDQPVCLAQEVVLGFDAYAVTGADPGAPKVDVVEAMHVRSWEEWVAVRDGLDELTPVVKRFDELVAPGGVTTFFATPIKAAGA